MTRLDKLVSDKMNVTRSQAKAMIKAGSVAVNGTAVFSPEQKCADADVVTVDGRQLDTREFVYIMMNKPKGVICATDGKGEKTVLDLLDDSMKRRGLFPAGRLDKDTMGFVLLTDDGEFAHQILSPKKHVVKTYIAVLDKPFDDSVAEEFGRGMTLGEEKLLPAKLTRIDENTAQIEISQGIFHQIKRMFKKHKITVLELKRIKMGGVFLDENLGEGECRYLNPDEIEKIRQK